MIHSDPFCIAMACAFENLAPEWKVFTVADSLKERVIDRLCLCHMAEARINAEVRQTGVLAAINAVFLAKGQDVNSRIDDLLAATMWGESAWDMIGIAGGPFTITKKVVQVRLADRGAALHALVPDAREVLDMMQLLVDGKVPNGETDVRLEKWDMWRPSELQIDIWNAVNNKGMTVDELEWNLATSRPTLFKKPGGLPELVEKGFLANDRAHGGYYRIQGSAESESN